MVDNLVTYIKSENFMDFTIEDGEDEFNSIKHLILSISLWKILNSMCVCRCMCLCMCTEVCIDNKLVTQIGPPNKTF